MFVHSTSPAFTFTFVSPSTVASPASLTCNLPTASKIPLSKVASSPLKFLAAAASPRKSPSTHSQRSSVLVAPHPYQSLQDYSSPETFQSGLVCRRPINVCRALLPLRRLLPPAMLLLLRLPRMISPPPMTRARLQAMQRRTRFRCHY